MGKRKLRKRYFLMINRNRNWKFHLKLKRIQIRYLWRIS